MNDLTVTPVKQPSRQPTSVSRSRLTVVENIVVSSTDSPQSVFDGSFSCRLNNGDEQPYGPRHIKVTEEWQPLDLGWLDGDDIVGMLSLRNDEGRNLLANPTPEQLATIAASVVDVAVDTLNSGLIPFSEVSAGRSIRLFPTLKLWVRCISGSARCTLFVVPS